MFLLLPPSETKTRPGIGPVLDLDALAHPALTAPRATVLRAAERTARSRGAAGSLKVPASAPELVERMAAITAEPCAPALEVYAGVLYDALGDARGDAERTVLVTSALLGVVDADSDRIPAYRLSAGSVLSRLGAAGAWWRSRLAPIARELAGSGRVVVDCRSGAYRSMMPVPGAIEVAAVRERDGKRTVVSHDAKRYRGLLGRVLLTAERAPADAEEVAHAGAGALGDGLAIELQGTTLTVVDRG